MRWLEEAMGVARCSVCAGIVLAAACGGTSRPLGDGGGDTGADDSGTGDNNSANTGDGGTQGTGDGGVTETWSDPGEDPVDPLTWRRTFDGNGFADEGFGVAVDSQDNVIAVGTSQDEPEYPLWVGKLDPFGNEIWTQRKYNLGYSPYGGIAVDSQDNLLITARTGGSAPFRAWVGKLDPQGNELWVRVFEERDASEGRGIAVDSDDNVIVTGVVADIDQANEDNSNYDIWLAKYDASGNQLWTQAIDMTSEDWGHGVAVDSAANIAVAGYRDEPAGSAWLAKHDPSGAEIWTTSWTTYGGLDGVAIDVDHNIVVVGSTPMGDAGSPYVFLAKCDADGSGLWNKTIIPGEYDGEGRAVAVDYAGNIVAAGHSVSAGHVAWIGKYDPDVNELWSELPDYGASDEANGIATDSLGYVVITGTTVPPGWGDDIFISKLAP